MVFRTLKRAALFCSLLAGVAMALPGVGAAQDKKVRIQMGSTYPGNLVQLGTLAHSFSKKLDRMSAGSIDVKFHEPGALVPALQVFDAISAGSLDAGWSTPGNWTGKDIAFAIFASVPFGPSAGEYMAWMYYGGGLKLMQDLYGKYEIVVWPCAIIAPEASGWFRKEIKSLDDLKGLKMRFFGLGAKVMEKFGVSTQLIAGGEIYQALQLGTIDATEFSMPAIDQALGFHQVAKHYYFPGWHQQATFLELMLSRSKWNELSEPQKAMVEMACGDNLREGLAQGEALQFKALQDLQAKGVTIHRWSKEILAAFEKSWHEVAAEEAQKSPEFKKAWESFSSFRTNYTIWRDIGYLD